MGLQELEQCLESVLEHREGVLTQPEIREGFLALKGKKKMKVNCHELQTHERTPSSGLKVTNLSLSRV